MHAFSTASLPLLACLFLAACAGAPAAQAEADAHIAPFDLASGRPMVMLAVNGEGPFPFVMDTGAVGLSVRPALVEELGLVKTGQDEINSPAGGTPVPVDVVSVASVDLAGARVENVSAIVFELGAGDQLGMGVVGPSMWSDHGAVTMDFAANTVAIGGDVYPDAGWIPLGESAPLLDAPVRIGDVEIPGHIDSGGQHVLAVPTAYADDLPLAGEPVTIGMARTIDRSFEIKAAPIDAEARIGDAVVPLNQVMLSDLPFANLGTAGLSGLTLVMDWTNDRFALSGRATPAAGPRRVAMAAPADGATPAYGDRAPFGVQLAGAPGGGFSVAGVIPGSRAEALGLQAGDGLVAINGTPLAEIAPQDMGPLLGTPPVALTVERGGETIELSE